MALPEGLSEIETFRAFINNLRSASAAAHHMATLRSDPRWMLVAGRLDQMRELATKVHTQKAAPTNRMILQ